MAALISQILSASFAAVVAEKRKGANQWAESSALRELEKQGFVVKKSFGSTIEAPLDYQRNPGARFQLTDMDPTATTKTEVLTTASYDIAEISVPIVWSKKDEVMNPSENQKVALTTGLISNGVDSHDDLIEQYFFATSTNGFLGLGTHCPDTGQSSDGGIDSTTYTFWRNANGTYVDDTDIESAFTGVWNSAAKGSGSQLNPTLMLSGSTPHAQFEGTQQGYQRYIDTQDYKTGAKTIAFKTCRYIFSQYGGTRVFFANPKNLQLLVSKEMFRDKGETREMQGVNAYETKIYSALQTITTNRSRLGVVHL